MTLSGSKCALDSCLLRGFIDIYIKWLYILEIVKKKNKTKYFQHDALPMYFMPVECIHFRLSLRKGKLFLTYFAGLSTLQPLR